MMGVLAARAAKSMQPLQSLRSLRIVKAKVKDSFQHESQPKSSAELPAALLKSQGQGSWEMGPCGESNPCDALPSAEPHKETDVSEPPQQPRTAKPSRSKPAVLAEATNRALKPIRKPKQYAQMLSEPDAEPFSGGDFDLEALPDADAADVAPATHADADAELAEYDCSTLPVPVRATATSATAASQKPIVGPIDFGFGTLTLDERPDLALPLMTVKYEKASINDAVSPSVRPSVRQSVRPPVSQSVGTRRPRATRRYQALMGPTSSGPLVTLLLTSPGPHMILMLHQPWPLCTP